VDNLRSALLRRPKKDDEINPLDGVANLADIMLVFACGLMLSLVISWNLDLGGLTTPVELDRDEGFTEIGGLEASDKQQQIDSDTYEKMGTVYRDPVTGEMYLLSENEQVQP
jgi:hypothetical protein